MNALHLAHEQFHVTSPTFGAGHLAHIPRGGEIGPFRKVVKLAKVGLGADIVQIPIAFLEGTFEQPHRFRNVSARRQAAGHIVVAGRGETAGVYGAERFGPVECNQSVTISFGLPSGAAQAIPNLSVLAVNRNRALELRQI